MGSIRDRKTVEKIYPKPQEIQSKPKTACKTVKKDKFSHPSYQNPNRTDAVSDKWSVKKFRNLLRSVKEHYCRSDREETGTQKEKSKTTSDTKSENSLVAFYENRKPNAKKRKSAYEHQNRRKNQSFFWHKKPEKTDLKKSQNRKTENPNTPLLTG